MAAAFDVYQPRSTVLHTLDPRAKFAVVVAGTLTLLLSDSWWTMAAALTIVHGILVVAGMSKQRVRALWRALVPFLTIVVVLWPIFDRVGEPILVEVGWFRVTGPALIRAVTAAARLAAISFLVAAWLATTSPALLIQGFVRLGLPRQWGVAVAIGLRSIPAIASQYRETLDAQHARGLILIGPPHRRLRLLLPVLLATFVSTIRLAEQTAWALESRAFGTDRRSTTRHRLTMRRRDWLVLMSVATLIGGLIVAGFLGVPI